MSNYELQTYIDYYNKISNKVVAATTVEEKKKYFTAIECLYELAEKMYCQGELEDFRKAVKEPGDVVEWAAWELENK